MNQPKEQVEVPEAAKLLIERLKDEARHAEQRASAHRSHDEHLGAEDASGRASGYRDSADLVLAALPAIEQAVEERVRERLFGKEAEKLLAARLYEEDQRRLGFPRRRLDKASNGPQRTYHARAFAHLAALSQPHNTEEEK